MKILKIPSVIAVLVILNSCVTQPPPPPKDFPRKGWTVTEVPTTQFKVGGIVLLKDDGDYYYLDDVQGALTNVSTNYLSDVSLDLNRDSTKAATLIAQIFNTSLAGGGLGLSRQVISNYDMEWNQCTQYTMKPDMELVSMALDSIRDYYNFGLFNPAKDKAYIVFETIESMGVEANAKRDVNTKFGLQVSGWINPAVTVTPGIGVVNSTEDGMKVWNTYDFPLCVSYRVVNYPLTLTRELMERPSVYFRPTSGVVDTTGIIQASIDMPAGGAYTESKSMDVKLDWGKSVDLTGVLKDSRKLKSAQQ
jgi:hypothetical protein